MLYVTGTHRKSSKDVVYTWSSQAGGSHLSWLIPAKDTRQYLLFQIYKCELSINIADTEL